MRPNNFFFSTRFRDTLFDVFDTLFNVLCLYICRQLSVFTNNSVGVCPIKLKIGMLCQMNNTVWNNAF